MVEKIKALITPPTYPDDEDKTRVAKLLNVILLSLAVFLSFNTIVAIRLLQNTLAIVLNASTVLIAVALFIAMRRGYVRLTAILTVSIFWTAVAGVNLTVTGFTIIIASSFFVLVFLAGVLINKRAAMLFAVLSIAAAFMGYQLGVQGQILAATPENPLVNVSATAVNLLVLAIIIYLNQQTLDDALARSKQSQRDLEAYQSQLEERVAERTRDLALANEVGRTVQTLRDVDRLLAGAIRIIQSYFDLYFAQIYLINEADNTLVLRAAEGQAAERLMRQGHFLPINMASINGRVAFEKQSLIVSDTSQDPIFRPNPLLPLTRSEMAVPLKTADRVLGVLDLQSAVVGAFSSDNLPAFEALAGQLAIALENAQLFTERRQTNAALATALSQAEAQAKNLALVNEMSAALEHNTQGLAGILKIANHHLQMLYPSWLRSFSFIKEDGQTIQLHPMMEIDDSPAVDLTFPLENSLLQFAIAHQRVVHIPEDAAFEHFADTRFFVDEGVSSGLIAPLIVGNEILGTLNLISKQPSAYSETDTNFFLQLSNLLATHIESQRLKDSLQRLANLVETHPDLIGIVTMNGRTTYLNATGLALMGLPPDHDTTQINYASFFAPEDVQRIQSEAMPTAMKTGLWTGQVTLNRPDGVTLPIDVTIAPHHDLTNTLVGFSVTARDVTERVQAIEAQRQLTLQLEERLLQVNALQRTMTHQGWSQFFTSPNRLIHGFMFDDEQIRLLSQADIESAEISQLPSDPAGQGNASLATPIQVRGETIGILGARTPEGEPLTPEQQEILADLSAELAEALERARLFEEVELAREQMNALFTGSERVVRARTLDEVLRALVESTVLNRLDRANILFFDRSWGQDEPERLTVTAVWEKSGQPALIPVGAQFSLDQLPSVRVVRKNSPAIFLDAANDPRIGPDMRLLTGQTDASSIILFPLVVSNQWFGILMGQSTNPVTLSEEEIRQIISLVDQAASVSQTQQLFEQARNRAYREQVLREITARVYAAVDAESILQTTAREIHKALGLETFVYLEGEVNGGSSSNGRHPAANPLDAAQKPVG